MRGVAGVSAWCRVESICSVSVHDLCEAEYRSVLTAFAKAADIVCFISLAHVGDVEMALILLKCTRGTKYSVLVRIVIVSILCAQRVSHF